MGNCETVVSKKRDWKRVRNRDMSEVGMTRREPGFLLVIPGEHAHVWGIPVWNGLLHLGQVALDGTVWGKGKSK